MKNKDIIFGKLILLTLVVSGILALQSCKKTPYGEDFDINYPTPNITSVISTGDVQTGVTILGTNLDKVLSVKLGGAIIGTAPFATQTANEITAMLPRKFAAGTITVENIYRRTATTPTVIAPIYPNVTITGWPTEVYADSFFVVVGKNMDLVSQIDVSGFKLDASGTGDTLQINTGGILAKLGTDSVDVTIAKALSIIVGPTSSPRLPVRKK